KELGCSPRTLQRKLREEGTCYAEVLAVKRRALAELYLSRTTWSLAEIGWLVGYEDQSSFHRAFYGWTGETPRGFRAAAGGADRP
ncbi:MAG: helix-turn-helix transcriptional regulator, partial [Myxococcota bacterium]